MPLLLLTPIITRRHKSQLPAEATEPGERTSRARRLPSAKRMYQAIPYSASRPWPPRPQPQPAPMEEAVVDAVAAATAEERLAVALPASEKQQSGEEVRRAVAECPVLVVGRRGCCLSHVVKRLLQGFGVNPAVHEVAGEAELAGVVADGDVALPAVFVGGRLLGGLDRLMAVHITGELVPILKDAGALWL